MLGTGHQREHFVQIGEVLLDAAGLAGGVAGGGDAAGQLGVKILKARQIVQLPAVDGHGNLVHAAQGLFGVYAPCGVDLPGSFVMLAHIGTLQSQLLL